MCLADFAEAWSATLDACIPHLAPGGRLVYLISPSVDGERVVDHAFDMLLVAWQKGLRTLRRIILTYNHDQATGQQVEWARAEKELLKRYRDIIVLERAEV